MQFRHYKSPSDGYGFYVWKPSHSNRWTLDILWGKNVFVFFRRVDK